MSASVVPGNQLSPNAFFPFLSCELADCPWNAADGEAVRSNFFGGGFPRAVKGNRSNIRSMSLHVLPVWRALTIAVPRVGRPTVTPCAAGSIASAGTSVAIREIP